jgi:hypothetical protein
MENGMCSVEGCDLESAAKGLCAMHYMRMRRHGDVTVTRKAGRPRDEFVAVFRKLECDAEMSPRSFSRMIRAHRCLKLMEKSEAKKVMDECTRPNGTLNHSALLRWGEAVLRAAKEQGFEGLDKWVK